MEVLISQSEKRSWVEVDLNQIRNNYMIYKQNLKRKALIMAVIKADAYSHGDIAVAKILSECRVNMFAVSNIDEAIGLREGGIKGEILILGYTSPKYADILHNHKLTQTIVSKEYAQALVKTGKKIRCQFAIDTGMNRIGLDADNPVECERIVREYSKYLEVNGLFTHLCVADAFDAESKSFTFLQLKKFKRIVEAIADLHFPYIHCCNSAAGLSFLDNSANFDGIGDTVRLGIVLYGLKPNFDFKMPEGILPALSWMSQVSMVKTVQPGESIGYGRSYTAIKEQKIATITTGYADGLNRHLSNGGHVLINGKKAPIVGRICMDQTMVDVTDIPNVKMGTKVTIIGTSGVVAYSADDMAKELGTIGYEVICGISKRVQRYYI